MNRTLSFLFLAAIYLSAVIPSAGQDARETAAALLGNAAKLTDIQAADAKPFRLRGHLRVSSPGKPPEEGTYLVLWASEAKWREEISLPSFHQIRWAREGKLWQKRSTSYKPWNVELFLKSLALSARMQLHAEEKVDKVRTVTRNGAQATCVAIKGQKDGGWTREICFDRVTSMPFQYRGQKSRVHFEYSDYYDLGERRFPRYVRAYDGGKLESEFHAEELSFLTDSDEAPFVPPVDVIPRDWCKTPTPPRLLNSGGGSLIFPAGTLTPGRIVFYGVIGTDGRLHDLSIIDMTGIGSSWAAFLREKMGKDTWQAASCNGVPVETELTTEIEFP